MMHQMSSPNPPVSDSLHYTASPLPSQAPGRSPYPADSGSDQNPPRSPAIVRNIAAIINNAQPSSTPTAAPDLPCQSEPYSQTLQGAEQQSQLPPRQPLVTPPSIIQNVPRSASSRGRRTRGSSSRPNPPSPSHSTSVVEREQVSAPTMPQSDSSATTTVLRELLSAIQKQNDNQSNLISALRTELSVMSSTLVSSVEKMVEHVGEPQKKKRKKDDDEQNLIALMDYIKTTVALHFLDARKGTDIFPRTPFGSDYSTVVMKSIDFVLDLNTPQSQLSFLRQKANVGRSEHYVSTFLERASGRLHDTVLSKFSDAFFGALPSHNVLSSSSDASIVTKEAFARSVHFSKEYYSAEEYKPAWQAACTTARREILAAGTVSRNGFLRQYPDKQVVDLPDDLSGGVSVYFLAFVVLKVCSMLSLIYFIIFFLLLTVSTLRLS